MADWTPPASDAVAAPTFVPPASDRVKKPEEENLPVVQHYADLAKLKPGTDYIDSAGARKTFTDQDSQDFAAKNFKGPGAGMLAGLPVSGSIPGSKAAKSILLQGGFGTAGAIAGSVFPGAGTIAGGAGGAALGNILDQETDPEYDANKPGLGIKKGQVLAAGLTGAIAPGSPVGTGLGGLAKAALREGVSRALLAWPVKPSKPKLMKAALRPERNLSWLAQFQLSQAVLPRVFRLLRQRFRPRWWRKEASLKISKIFSRNGWLRMALFSHQ